MSPTTFACLCAPELGENSYSEENGTAILPSSATGGTAFRAIYDKPASSILSYILGSSY